MKFALTGAAGYVAPRHMRAIVETGNELVAALDPHDSVGILDCYAPHCAYFTEDTEFWRFTREMKQKGGLDYVSICSPNYLHVDQIVTARCQGLDVICEKPISTTVYGLALAESYDLDFPPPHVSTIMQLRLHPAVVELKQQVEAAKGHRWTVELTYVTPRGPWYDRSWKSDARCSGGLLLNIGIHLFDLLLWVFGPCVEHEIHRYDLRHVGGWLGLERADITWFLSTDPDAHEATRSLMADGERVDFSHGFDSLHTESYKQILAGKGFRVSDARPSIELVDKLRTDPRCQSHASHPLCRRLP